MSFEFRAAYGAARPAIPIFRLAQALKKRAGYRIESITDQELSLRFPDAVRQDSWPEDASIHLEDLGVYVAIHGGTKAQRNALIEHLTEVYLDLGSAVTFEEL